MMELQISNFKSSKMMLLKCCTQYVNKFGILSSSHITEKGWFSFQSQRWAASKNVQTTAQLHSSYMLTRSCSKSSKLGFKVCEQRTSRCTSWIQRRQRNQRSNCQHQFDHRKSKGIKKKIYFCFTDYTKAFDCVDHNKLWEMGIPDYLTCLLRNLCASQEATVKNQIWNNRLVPNWERSTSRLYIVTLFI